MLRPREEGSGGRDGIVLNLTMSGDGVWNAVYSVKVFVGKSEQPLMLSVDTGSSDVWLASKDCQSSACNDAHTTLYDSSSSRQTNENLELPFLRGSISGPIVWDAFKMGPYSIPFQALAAADQVSDEPLSSDFVGLLGLALPPNSKIAQQIPATESDSPDGATLQMNLFGLTPVETAPEQRFFSLSLERPGSSRIPSLLGIGKHPSNLVPGFDPSKVAYSELIHSKPGDTFWRVPVMNITAWVDGAPKPIQLGRSTALPTSLYTVALVDSGGPNILASVDIVNGIYGAWGIGPGQDGNYYVPCTTPMNISLGLANFPPIALHPLDITSPPQSSKADSSSSTTCLGQIQAAPSDKLLGFADIVLGVSFLRNVYTVLSSSSSANAFSSIPGSPNPRLGILPLTDPATAMSEFHSVRVLGQPLEQSPPPSQPKSTTVGKKLSVGVIVLVCIVGFFVACGLLFGMRWWLLRRRFKRKEQTEKQGKENWAQNKDGNLDEDALRAKRWEEGKQQGLFYPESSIGSEFTRIEQSDSVAGTPKEGARARSLSRPRSPASSASELGHVHGSPETASPDDSPEPHRWSAMHVRTVSPTDQGGAAAVPLLDDGEASPWLDTSPAHERVSSPGSVSFADEAGMAGVGARSSTASSSGRTSRSRLHGPRVASGGSISSVASRMWHAEVGHVLEPVEDPPRP